MAQSVATLTEDDLWTRELAARVGTYGNGPWLTYFDGWLGAGSIDLKSMASDFAAFLQNKGLLVKFAYHADCENKPDPNFLVVVSVQFEPGIATLPFGLDPISETPQSAMSKLSSDVSSAAQRFTFFLSDNRFVGVEFNKNMAGLIRVAIGHLGEPIRYDTRHQSRQ